MKLRKGDKVKIIKGKDRGKSGKILKVFSQDSRVLVEGLHLFKKHAKPKKQGEKGEIVIVPRPMSVGNVMIECPNCGKPTRIGYVVESGKKERVCRKCNARV